MSITFDKMQPKKVFFAQHEWGPTKLWNSTDFEKEDERPVAYSAVGSHATYLTPGTHDILYGLARDHTAKK